MQVLCYSRVCPVCHGATLVQVKRQPKSERLPPATVVHLREVAPRSHRKTQKET